MQAGACMGVLEEGRKGGVGERGEWTCSSFNKSSRMIDGCCWDSRQKGWTTKGQSEAGSEG